MDQTEGVGDGTSSNPPGLGQGRGAGEAWWRKRGSGGRTRGSYSRSRGRTDYETTRLPAATLHTWSPVRADAAMSDTRLTRCC